MMMMMMIIIIIIIIIIITLLFQHVSLPANNFSPILDLIITNTSSNL